MNARTMAMVSLVLGAVGILAEFANFFPSKHGATGIVGAILFASGVIALAVVQTKSRD
jgi:hypothetical protein